MSGAHRPVRTEEGLSLVEVIVTVAIMGIAFVSILGGMWTAIVTTDTHRKQALATTYLVSAAEHLKSSVATPYATCASTYSLAGIASTVVPVDWKAAMTVAVEHWTGTAFDGSTATCATTTSTTRFDLQQVTITASSPVDARATESLTFVKRPE
ncbi:MAG: type II secretion system protein [Actinomycetota bacterium]|nr:type II secretion system protein [Actinomycetota bacterium]